VDPDSKRPRQRGGATNGRAPRLRVTVSDGRGRPIRDDGLSQWLASVAPSSARGEVAIALVTDAHSRKLNSQYRRESAPTDVLSFPSSGVKEAGFLMADAASADAVNSLGDIVIATGTARKQAKAARHSYQAELRVLALHGLLHLLGYDHEDADDAGRMRRVEARLRRRGGLTAGLIERS
jgi:probable rRNA maturation factor